MLANIYGVPPDQSSGHTGQKGELEQNYGNEALQETWGWDDGSKTVEHF